MSNEQPTPQQPAPTSPPPPPPPRRRRWFLRLFVGLVVLLVVVFVLLAGVQYALQNTDYARNIALPIVERKLGLRLHAKGLKVSLFGHTELTDVGVSLPLDKTDFLVVPQIKVRHGNLLQIILNLGVPLDDIEVDSPTVKVVQDASGQWNLIEVVDILGKLGGSNNPQPTATSGGVPKLPAVHLLDGTIDITTAKGDKAQVYPLNVSGVPDHDNLVFRYDLSAGPKDAELLKAGGVVAPGGQWVHEVTVALGNLDPLAKAFGVPSTYAAGVHATWDGKLTDGHVGGRLTLADVSATAVPTLGNVGVTGAVDVTTGGTAAAPVPGSPTGGVAGPPPIVTITPADLMLATENPTVPTLGVVTGAIVYDAAGLHAKDLKVNALGGAASVDLSADPKTQNVDFAAHWTGLTLAAGISQAGSVTASVRQPFPGQPLVRVELDDRGSIGGTPATAAVRGGQSNAAGGGTRWDAGVQVVGQGTSWSSIDWVLAVPRLNVDSGGGTYDLSGISAQVQQRPTTIDLIGLTLPPTATANATAAPATAADRTLGGGSRSTTGTPAPGSGAAAAASPGAPTGTSPFGLTFASSAHVTLPDAKANRPLSWKTNVTAGLTARYQGEPVPVTVVLDADGDAGLYTLRKLSLNAADANVNVDGQYDLSNPKPVALHVALTQTPRLTPNAPVQGTFAGDFKIVGLLFDVDPAADAADVAATRPAAATRSVSATRAAALVASTQPTTSPSGAATSRPAKVRTRHLRPYLTTTGDLRTSELVVFGKPIGDIDIRLQGDVQTPPGRKTANGTASADAPPPPGQVHVELHSTDFALFQAPWDLHVDYPNDDGAAEVNLSTSNLPLDVLEKAAGMGDSPPVRGQLAAAHWKVTATGPGLADIRLTSEYHLTDLQAAGLDVDTVDATATFADGLATLAPVTAKRGTGTTTVSATYALAQPDRVHTVVDVRQWPFPLGSALGGSTEARANAKVDLDVHLPTKAATAADAAAGAGGAATSTTGLAGAARPSSPLGTVQAYGTASASVDVLLHPPIGGRALPQTLAHAQLAAELHGQSVDLSDVSGRVLNGTFQGAAQVDVSKPLEAVGRVEWKDVDAAALYTITDNPALKDLGGVFSGTVTVAPSRDPRTLEPVRIDVFVAAKGGHFRSVMLGTGDLIPPMVHAVAYANIDRAVLDHSDVFVCGGLVHLWGRVGRNLASQTVIVDYADLSLNQLAQVVPGAANGPVPGTLSGTLRAVRNGSGLGGLIGGGHVAIADADLYHIPAIGKLYDLLGHGGNGLQPNGTGGIDLALEASTARITSLRFFNRGIEAKGLLKAGPIDLSDVNATPLTGQVVGTLNDLKGTRLPFFSDFNQTFNALQGGLTAVNVTGTLSKPVITQAGADELGNQLKELLVGDAQNASGQDQ